MNGSNAPNYYEVLGVPPSATVPEIRQAYKREALRHHPDKNPDRREEATERFKQLAEAYSVLSDAQARADYDRGSQKSTPNRSSSAEDRGFSVSEAFDVFREVYGKRFMAGLSKVVKEAAPHVRNAAQATAYVVANALDSALDHLNQPKGNVRSQVDSSANVGAFCRPVDAASTRGTAGAPSSYPTASTGVVYEIDSSMLWLCTLSWRQSTINFDISACLAGCDGLYLGVVDGQNGDAALQFQECGVRHIASNCLNGTTSQTIEMDMRKFSMNDMFRYVFIHIRVGALRDGTADEPCATFSLRTEDNVFAFPQMNLSTSRDSSNQGGSIILSLARSKQRWFATQCTRHCAVTLADESQFQKVLASFSHDVEESVSKYLEQKNEEKELSDAIAAVEAVSDEHAGFTRDILDDLQLVESIMLHTQKGNYARAVEGQEELISRLMEYEDRDGDDRWQTRIVNEFARMDRLLEKISTTSGSIGSSSSSAKLVGTTDATLPQKQAVHEALDEVGFQNIVALRDDRAMQAFIRRILESRGGQLWPDADIEIFAEMFINKGDWSFDSVVWELFTKGGPAPSGANATDMSKSARDLDDHKSTQQDVLPPPCCAQREFNPPPRGARQVEGNSTNIAQVEEEILTSASNIVFGFVGRNAKISDDGRTVTRVESVSDAVCISKDPLPRRAEGGYYFEVLVKEVSKSIRTIAVGFRVGPLAPTEVVRGHVCAGEARQLDRVWLAGYDKAGAIFFYDGCESKIPAATWRPVRDTKLGTRLGIMWLPIASQDHELRIFQDGKERVRLSVPSSNRLPAMGEELFAVVDLQGTIRSVSFSQNPSAPCSETPIAR